MITGASRPTGAVDESSGCFVVDLSSLDARSEGPRSIPDGLKGTKSTPSHFIANLPGKGVRERRRGDRMRCRRNPLHVRSPSISGLHSQKDTSVGMGSVSTPVQPAP